MKINLDSLKLAIETSGLTTIAIVGVVAILCYIAEFYSWLFNTYSPVVAALVLAVFGFLILAVVSYIIAEQNNKGGR